jgi:hypothetical protein
MAASRGHDGLGQGITREQGFFWSNAMQLVVWGCERVGAYRVGPAELVPVERPTPSRPAL